MSDYVGPAWVLFMIIFFVMAIAFAPVIILLVQFCSSINLFVKSKGSTLLRKVIIVYWGSLVLNTCLLFSTYNLINEFYVLLSYSVICVAYQIIVIRETKK